MVQEDKTTPSYSVIRTTKFLSLQKEFWETSSSVATQVHNLRFVFHLKNPTMISLAQCSLPGEWDITSPEFAGD